MQSVQPNVPNSAPLWLPHPPSGGGVPAQPSTASGGSGASAAAGLAHGWGPLPAHPPGFSSNEGGSSEEHGAQGRQANRDRMRLEQLVEADWRIPPEAIEIMKRPDGSPWQLGSGGFGTVFKAMRNGVTPVAVKVLGAPVESARKMMDDEDFYREIMILRACRDTNILQFQGACFKDDRTLLVTEYMEGGNLTANLKAHTVTWYKRGKKIALDVARALVYLHSRKIVHLDVKSANVLLTRDGTAKLGDVGMAKIMAEGYVSGGQGAFGTLAWSAPELLLGRRCDGKADLYSFGVVLWEICTGMLPVRGQLREPSVPEECPEEVLGIIRRCLDADPNVRPTAAELVQLLTLAPAPPPPGGSTPVRRGSQDVGRPPATSSAAASAAASRQPSDAAVRVGSGEATKISPASTVLEPIPSAALTMGCSLSGAPLSRTQSSAYPQPRSPGAPGSSLPPLPPSRRSGEWSPCSEAAAGAALRSVQLSSPLTGAGEPSNAAAPQLQQQLPSPWARASAAGSGAPLPPAVEGVEGAASGSPAGG